MKIRTVLLAALAAFSFSANAVTILSNDFNGSLNGFSVVDNIAGASWGLSGGANNETDNWTSGTGDAASASSDANGVAAYDTELISTVFSLDGLSSASMSYLVNYQAIGLTPTDGALEVDISTDGGMTWDLLFGYDNDTPVGGLRNTDTPTTTNIDLAAYLGESSVITRWHYFNNDPGAFDWYAQIDDVLIEGMPASTVAEPSSLALIGLGLIGVAALRRRRG
ncbi:MAG: PEP-CTERM sorting domain-containing protein [Gammaproteobacteria bacterium]|nr:PEP-CTERM sorting domain-containing protein [Gammaproteobacteria bacterium]